MNPRRPDATVHIMSSTVAEVHVGTEVAEVVAPDTLALRDRVVEEIRLLAESAGEPAHATLVEGSSRWPLVVHPDGTYAEALEEASTEAVDPTAPAEPVREPLTQRGDPATLPVPEPVPATPVFSEGPQPAPAFSHRPDAAGKPTVQDLLESRGGNARPGAKTGWQGVVRRATGGLVSPAPGRVERLRLDREKRVQRRLDAPRTIVVLNPKGGAHKTTSTLLLAATFGSLRGGATLAWDNNETRGTLGWRAQHTPHHRTAVDLLEDLDEFWNPNGSSLAALDTYVRTQVDARFDVLASDEDAAASSTIDAAAFDRLHSLLRRYYRLMIVDTGNNMRASNWTAAVAAADQLVIVSTVREDTAASAAWLLDGLREKGFGEKIDEAVTVLTAPSARPDRRLEARLSHHFEQVTSAVVNAPFDPSLVDGGPIDFDALAPETRDAWLTVAATVADQL
jgi:MinD-like ATPase involved in chromosome partitioning or flagellar assembly